MNATDDRQLLDLYFNDISGSKPLSSEEEAANRSSKKSFRCNLSLNFHSSVKSLSLTKVYRKNAASTPMIIFPKII